VIKEPVMIMGKAEDIPESADAEMIENHSRLDDGMKISSDVYVPQSPHTSRKTKEEKALLLKADLCIVPLAALCYLVSYLVRFALSHIKNRC
jgi:hypothetical protein